MLKKYGRFIHCRFLQSGRYVISIMWYTGSWRVALLFPVYVIIADHKYFTYINDFYFSTYSNKNAWIGIKVEITNWFLNFRKTDKNFNMANMEDMTNSLVHVGHIHNNNLGRQTISGISFQQKMQYTRVVCKSSSLTRNKYCFSI